MEVWKKYKDSFYEVSNYGNVRSLDRYVEVKTSTGFYTKLTKGKSIKKYINGSGYEQLILYIDNKKRNLYVHKMVAELFLDNKNENNEVNHIDHDKLNNRYDNLEWCTRKHNIEKMVQHYNKSRKKEKCLTCNKEFTKREAKSIFCSIECRNESFKKSDVSELDIIEYLKENIKTKTKKEISFYFKVSTTTINRWLKKYNINGRN